MFRLRTTSFLSSKLNSSQLVRGRCLSGINKDETLKESINIPGVQSEGKKLAIVFTCDKCSTRSAKQISEQAYHKGVVIVRCPGCQVDHLIADRIGIFEDGAWDIEKALSGTDKTFKRVTDDNVLELTIEDMAGLAPQK
mmetsp:Transcript_7909/g.10224  ORF Transcript_7909/g.10224 Transcript_7909/m.10224 type:complete len:139 (-) Transcript_7909:182-598(-)